MGAAETGERDEALRVPASSTASASTLTTTPAIPLAPSPAPPPPPPPPPAPSSSSARGGDAGGQLNYPPLPPADVVVASRCGDVLTRATLLKSDHFPGCQNRRLRPLVEGAPNFRSVPGLPVFGVAIPTAAGLRRALEAAGAGPGGGGAGGGRGRDDGPGDWAARGLAPRVKELDGRRGAAGREKRLRAARPRHRRDRRRRPRRNQDARRGGGGGGAAVDGG